MKNRNSVLSRVLTVCCGAGRYQGMRTAFFCILLSLLAGSMLLAVMGKNPVVAYQSILQGAGFLPKIRYAGHRSMITDFMSLLDNTTPMIFASLSVAVALKCGLFNIGVSGMMIASGFIASVTAGYAPLTAAAARPLVIFIGICTGGFIGMLIGLLRYRFNANEVVVAIMCNYIISYITGFFIQTACIDPSTRQSIKITEQSRLTLFDTMVGNLRMEIPLMLPIAILCAVLLWFLFEKTVLGFELKAVGMNRTASRYIGIDTAHIMILSMTISGMLAGLAGVSYYLGCFSSIQPKVLPSVGFDCIAVALLGNCTPAGCVFASLLIMTISCGTTYMTSRLGVLREIAGLITGLLLLFSACSAYFKARAEAVY